jgi:hypothetical protein
VKSKLDGTVLAGVAPDARLAGAVDQDLVEHEPARRIAHVVPVHGPRGPVDEPAQRAPTTMAS